MVSVFWFYMKTSNPQLHMSKKRPQKKVKSVEDAAGRLAQLFAEFLIDNRLPNKFNHHKYEKTKDKQY